jgi:hypothetical protein
LPSLPGLRPRPPRVPALCLLPLCGRTMFMGRSWLGTAAACEWRSPRARGGRGCLPRQLPTSPHVGCCCTRRGGPACPAVARVVHARAVFYAWHSIALVVAWWGGVGGDGALPARVRLAWFSAWFLEWVPSPLPFPSQQWCVFARGARRLRLRSTPCCRTRCISSSMPLVVCVCGCCTVGGRR